MAGGRFAPSPTGSLHLGNLRTALAASISARGRRVPFVVRMEDLDRVTASKEHELGQLADLAAIGIDWDGEVVRQSERFERYADALSDLVSGGRTYSCWCTRREIREAAAAPHSVGAEGRYPGACRDLSVAEINKRREGGRPPAVRLRADGAVMSFDDLIAGSQTRVADDVVLRRNDGVPAYQLAVVIDDAAQGIDEVIRGDDLLDSTAAQLLLIDLLGLDRPTHGHVPLVVAPNGERLAKRHGAVTLGELAARGVSANEVRSRLLSSLGWSAVDPAANWSAIPSAPFIYHPGNW